MVKKSDLVPRWRKAEVAHPTTGFVQCFSDWIFEPHAAASVMRNGQRAIRRPVGCQHALQNFPWSTSAQRRAGQDRAQYDQMACDASTQPKRRFARTRDSEEVCVFQIERTWFRTTRRSGRTGPAFLPMQRRRWRIARQPQIVSAAVPPWNARLPEISPMPPAPIAPDNSYGPSLLPEVSVMASDALYRWTRIKPLDSRCSVSGYSTRKRWCQKLPGKDVSVQ
jgi:hypothetical protein